MNEREGGSIAVAVAPSAQIHPFAATAAELEDALSGMQLRSHEARLKLRLPARNGSPVPSQAVEDIVDVFNDDDGPPPAWVETSVDALSLEPEQSFQFLTAPVESVMCDPGESIAWWRRAASVLESLLIDARFIPTVLQHPHGLIEGAWLPFLRDTASAQQVRSLIALAPTEVRAACDAFAHRTWPMVFDALGRMTDAVVRRVLVEHEFIEAIAGRNPSNDAHIPLLQTLLGAERMVRPGTAVAAELFRDVRRWLARLDDAPAGTPFHLAVRIAPPEMGRQHAASLGLDAEWLVTLSIRIDQSGREIEVSHLWAGGEPLFALPVPIDQAQEFVLEEIARFRPLWPRMGDALEESSIGVIRLSTEEAHEFLTGIAPVLEEAGISVDAPPWWGSPAGRLGARLALAPNQDEPTASGGAAGSAASARLGLQTLVRFAWQLSVGDRVLSLEEFRRIAQSGAPLIFVEDRWVEVRAEDVQAAESLLKAGVEGEMTILEALQSAYGLKARGPHMNIVGLEADGWIRELLDGTSDGSAIRTIEQPASLRGRLRPYQRAGLSWLVFLDEHGLGACLADDMGLGKTIQLIALLLHERASGVERRPTLVVAPMSVISNWQREIEQFGPELRVHVHHGADRPTGPDFDAAVGASDVILTTYGLASRDVETLSRVHWGRVALDEAQYVKNTPTKQAQAIRTLRTDRRVALTGTPIENRLTELWSIMDFLNPGYLSGENDFRQRFAAPIERERNMHRAESLRGLIRPFVLRRLKTDPDVVPDLPDLVKTKEYAALTPEQAALYEEVVRTMIDDVEAAQGIQRRGLVLAGIVKLKQICNHPANLPDALPGGEPAGESSNIAAARSGKVKAMLPILDEIVAAGGKALIFTQYRRMGHLLSRIIERELDIPVQFMHGGTSRAKRQVMIDRFQQPDASMPVFVLSLRAGGVGLNLTAANHVIHFDRWWNPAVEAQATDRAFRIGQTRNVHVHTLICAGTLEERIDEMLEQKTDLAESIVGSGDAWVTELSTSQLRELLALRDSALEEEPG